MPPLNRNRFALLVDLVVAALSLGAMAVALQTLLGATRGLVVESTFAGETPVTIYRPATGARAPVVLIAHGFAGSRQLMVPFAVTCARSGYTAVTFDFLGHGRHPRALTGSITEVTGATRALVAQTTEVSRFARGLGDGRLAVLGHSMATDIIVRFAEAEPDVMATVAVSMFSPAVTATEPRNLLVVVGEWESRLRQAGRDAVGLASAPEPAQEGVTYGDLKRGTGRRAAIAEGVEHIGVLYARTSMREALAWLDASFGRVSAPEPYLDRRGGSIVLLLLGVVALGRSLARFLPVVSSAPLGASLAWRKLWPVVVIPAVLTPLFLRVIPTSFLPVLVGDYLAAHFAMYGLLTGLGLFWVYRRGDGRPVRAVPASRWALAAVGLTTYGLLGIALPLDTFVASFVPSGGRIVLVLAIFVGTLPYFLTNEWLTLGAGAARGAQLVSKIAFLISLGLAVALDFERLFFLVLIVPAIVVFFLVYGLFSRWAYRRTGHPFVAGIANAIWFAWALGVTFPLLAK